MHNDFLRFHLELEVSPNEADWARKNLEFLEEDAEASFPLFLYDFEGSRLILSGDELYFIGREALNQLTQFLSSFILTWRPGGHIVVSYAECREGVLGGGAIYNTGTEFEEFSTSQWTTEKMEASRQTLPSPPGVADDNRGDR